MPEKPSEAADRSSPFERLRRAVSRSPVGRGWRRSVHLELGSRALGFSALGLLTLVPLLIIVSSADPQHGRGFAQWLGEGLGVSTAAREQVEMLFARPGQALRSTTVFGIAALALFGLAFGAAVQTGYEKVWDLPPARWWARWRHVVWLGVLTGYLFASATTTLRPEPLAGGAVASLSAVLFLWWSQHLLLGGRMRWRALLPGAVATVIGLLGLRIFSALVFSPLIASNAVAYGPVGTVLVVESWLLGVGVVIFGGALVGRLLYEETPPVRHAHGNDAGEDRPADARLAPWARDGAWPGRSRYAPCCTGWADDQLRPGSSPVCPVDRLDSSHDRAGSAARVMSTVNSRRVPPSPFAG